MNNENSIDSNSLINKDIINNKYIEEDVNNTSNTLYNINSIKDSNYNEIEMNKFSDNNEKNIIVIDKNYEKPICDRYFSKMDPGSLRSSIFSLTIISVGVGTLALPQKFAQISVGLCLIMILIGACTTYWTLDILIIAGRKCKLSNYSDVIKNYCGKFWGLLYDINIIIYLVGILIVYQITAYKMIGGFIYEIGNIDKSKYHNLDEFLNKSVWSEMWLTILIMTSIACVFLLPLYLLKDISKLRFSTLFGLICLFLTTLVLIIQLPDFLKQNEIEGITYNWLNFSNAFTSDFYFFRGAGTIFFAFNCHYGAFPIYDKLENNNKRRQRKAFYRSTLIDVFFFLVIGTCGYLTSPKSTPDLIINRNGLKSSNNDILMTICRLLVFCLIIAKCPVNYNSLRLSVFNIVFKTTEIDTKRNIIVTLIFCFGTALIGAVYTNIGQIINFLGGFCGVIISYFFPAFIYVRSKNHGLYHWKNIVTCLICGTLGFIGLFSAALAIKDMIQGKSSGH